VPEILEIEMYRRGALPVVGRTIERVDAPDDWYLKGVDARAVAAALTGATIEDLGRHGKLMLVDTTAAVCGLRFGMTGRLVVDDDPVISKLEYSTGRLDPSWDRFRIEFAGGGSLVMNDPRRLGGISLDPDVEALGPDVWSIGASDLEAILRGRKTPLKALLLDQKRLAGLGNLLVDEVLWRAGLAPTRSAGGLDTGEGQILAETIRAVLDELFVRGGSHRGDHVSERNAAGRCPSDGAEFRHDTVGGRSTWWCPQHQR
jgi:formamidopyrimidine-DNA glycosylase